MAQVRLCPFTDGHRTGEVPLHSAPKLQSFIRTWGCSVFRHNHKNQVYFSMWRSENVNLCKRHKGRGNGRKKKYTIQLKRWAERGTRQQLLQKDQSFAGHICTLENSQKHI